MELDTLKRDIFLIADEHQFSEIALQIFRHQAANNSCYRQYIRALSINPANIDSPLRIPFLPIEFFKQEKIITGTSTCDIIFTSSGTEGIPSKHFVSDISIYEASFLKGFKHFFGDPENYVILALLPSYLEREGSSLIFMMERLIKLTKNPNSGFYLYDNDQLVSKLKSVRSPGKKIILWGVTFALLELAQNYKLDLSDAIIVETGGMKGRKKELTRQELHAYLLWQFNASTVHSEYGMTELLSQAYSKGNGIFCTPPWMKVLIRDINDPLSVITHGKTGGINVIDLANVNSCSFISTQDLGKVNEDGSFEVLGRFDNSDLRGCNLLFSDTAS
jgi:hypothetical protein